jgi:tetratricopeptide (TPR) repeat protein
MGIAYSNRGVAHSEMGNPQQAIADQDMALRYNPRDGVAYYNRGNAKRDLGDETGAIADFTQAVALDPNLADAWGNRGNMYRRAGNLQAALLDLNRALSIRAGSIDFSNRGLVYIALGDYGSAIADFDSAAQLSPNDPDYQGRRCWYRAVANIDLHTARQACDRAIAMTARDPARLANNYDSRALVSLREGRWQDAYNDYDAAVRLTSGAHWIFGRGYAAYRLGRVSESQADFAAALRLETGMAEQFAMYGFSVPPAVLNGQSAAPQMGRNVAPQQTRAPPQETRMPQSPQQAPQQSAAGAANFAGPGGPGRHVYTFNCTDNTELRITFDNEDRTAIVARIRRPPATLRAAPLSGGGDFHYANQNYDLSGTLSEVVLTVGSGEPMRCPRRGG